jgi:tetratricopeptide (TPR) repeat protein
MSWRVVIAHAPGEEALAERIALPLQQEGYLVSHRGTVLVGESFSEEANKALGEGGPVVLCATVKALGTGWAHRLVNAAQAQGRSKRLFVVRMEEGAYLDQIVAGAAVAEWWRSSEEGSQRLIEALRAYYPLKPAGPASEQPRHLSTAFVDSPAPGAALDWQAVRAFRGELRETTRRDFPSELTDSEFLERAGFLRQQHPTLCGVLLFGTAPASVLPWAFARCVVYRGNDKTADREPFELRGTIPEQIRKILELIATHTRVRERPHPQSAQAERIFEYPMLTAREIVANALVHRDYEDQTRCVHVRLFQDRIEVLSPGPWTGRPLPEDGSPVSLESLVSESVKRNLSLATAVSWIRLVEGEGSGLSTAIEECRKTSAPAPSVCLMDGFVKVTVAPRSEWPETPHPAAVMITPHQLPAAPADLTGREKELATLLAAVRNGTHLVATVGLGGIGKTALALRLAAELQATFADAQLFLNLHGGGSTPLSAAEAMTQVIRAFLPDLRLPGSEDELAAIYRSVLANRRTLLLLDDAAGAEQVLPLIPPPGNLLLVTSRSHFALPGLLVLGLETLNPEDARALLLRIAPRIGPHADAIAVLLGHLPLALRLTATTLAERPDLSVEEYVERLTDSRTRLHLAEASINLSFELLTHTARRQWNRLAVFPDDFDYPAAAAVWECEPENAQEALGDLLKASLLSWGEQRYRLHDLLRLFAESRLPPEERSTAERLHARHFLKVLREANTLYQEGGEALARGLALFDREWENIQAGQAWAAQIAASDEEATFLCSEYPRAGAFCLDLRLAPRGRIRWSESALAAAVRRNDPEAQGYHLGILGNVHLSLGAPESAISLYERWVEIAHQSGDRQAEGQATGNLGSAYLVSGEPRRAIPYFEKSLEMARAVGDRRSEGTACGNLASTFAALGDLKRALALYERRLAIAREEGDRRSEGIALGNLGNIYEWSGETEKAIGFLEQRLAIAREVGDRRGEGLALENLGNALVILGQTRQPIELFEIALAIQREVGDRQSEAQIAWTLGLLYGNSGDRDLAAPLLQMALAFLRERGHPQVELQAAKAREIIEGGATKVRDVR